MVLLDSLPPRKPQDGWTASRESLYQSQAVWTVSGVPLLETRRPPGQDRGLADPKSGYWSSLQCDYQQREREPPRRMRYVLKDSINSGHDN